MTGWAILAALIGLVVLDLTARWLYMTIALPLFEGKVPLSDESFSPDPDAERVSFPTTHGLTLRGSLYRHTERRSRGAVVFCPEFGGSHWSALSYCGGLWEAGFDVLAFDFRNQGESDSMPGYDPLHWLTDFEVADVRAAVAYARQRDDLRDVPLGLFGVSRGGAAALAGAALCQEVGGVACEGAFSTAGMQWHYTFRWAELYVPAWVMRAVPPWHLRGTLALVRLVSGFRRRCRYTPLERLLPRLRGRPLLMIAGERDLLVPPETVRPLARQVDAGGEPVWIVPEAKHNQARPAAPAEYDCRLVELFSRMICEESAVHCGPLS